MSAVVLQSILQATIFTEVEAGVIASPTTSAPPMIGAAGVDRVVVLPGRTYLRGWAGYGEPPRRGARRPTVADSVPKPSGPALTVAWSRVSGPGRVTFAKPTDL